MRPLILTLLLSATFAPCVQAQRTQSTRQSARQAVIEMFLAKGGDNFVKHLPEDTKRALFRHGETPASSIILRFASFAAMGPLGEQFETFDNGPNILVSETPNEGKRIEVAVEHDNMLGDTAEIELSVHVYFDGQEQSMQILPRLIFTLHEENHLWRLNEVTFEAHVPLTDPAYLNGLRNRQDEFNESTAQGRISMIARAETSYAEEHPDSGFTCSLANLFPPPTATPDQMTYYDANLLKEESNGYRFSFSGCNERPADNFQITAVPIDSDSSMRSFCSDQSGTINWIAGGPIASCLSEGQPLNDGSEAAIQE